MFLGPDGSDSKLGLATNFACKLFTFTPVDLSLCGMSMESYDIPNADDFDCSKQRIGWKHDDVVIYERLSKVLHFTSFNSLPSWRMKLYVSVCERFILNGFYVLVKNGL